MYHHIAHFIEDWQALTGYTVRVFELITEDTKQIKIHENVRTLERLAWHITQTITEMGTRAGLFDADETEHQLVPATMADIAAVYKANSDRLITAVQTRWNDAALNEKVNMYGEEWSKGTVLSVLIGHESHHRSQMTVIMRMVDLPVPGIFGPSKEEWEQMGLPAME
ncbi:hypothetical protein KHS38_11495 [Mucilaginibacter sp. Bleaf8]|uniref:DinB family protein n=1 Tax=Mucilaginibacter sp. Bleaf8 TaxID=2834430 RepID=UPI001BCFA6FC|nr:DinB family protein [Mucilaginibacter sp. Bleaf8]MBS7565029.1 hypothetical protein [Mucilaginibacter sp. Bleaf8]